MQDLGSNQYGPFLVMQYGGVLLVLIGLALAVYRGSRDRKLSTDQQSLPGGIRWYFDGPLNAALQTLRDDYRVLSSIDGHVAPIGEEMRKQTELLKEIKVELSDLRDIGIRRR